jgi:hypothetical protein
MIFDNGKKAENIATIVPEKDNPYEENIHNAAVTLSESGYSDAIYLTLYSTGNSLWRLPGVAGVAWVRLGLGGGASICAIC